MNKAEITLGDFIITVEQKESLSEKIYTEEELASKDIISPCGGKV